MLPWSTSVRFLNSCSCRSPRPTLTERGRLLHPARPAEGEEQGHPTAQRTRLRSPLAVDSPHGADARSRCCSSVGRSACRSCRGCSSRSKAPSGGRTNGGRAPASEIAADRRSWVSRSAIKLWDVAEGTPLPAVDGTPSADGLVHIAETDVCFPRRRRCRAGRPVPDEPPSGRCRRRGTQCKLAAGQRVGVLVCLLPVPPELASHPDLETRIIAGGVSAPPRGGCFGHRPRARAGDDSARTVCTGGTDGRRLDPGLLVSLRPPDDDRERGDRAAAVRDGLRR